MYRSIDRMKALHQYGVSKRNSQRMRLSQLLDCMEFGGAAAIFCTVPEPRLYSYPDLISSWRAEQSFSLLNSSPDFIPRHPDSPVANDGHQSVCLESVPPSLTLRPVENKVAYAVHADACHEDFHRAPLVVCY